MSTNMYYTQYANHRCLPTVVSSIPTVRTTASPTQGLLPPAHPYCHTVYTVSYCDGCVYDGQTSNDDAPSKRHRLHPARVDYPRRTSTVHLLHSLQYSVEKSYHFASRYFGYVEVHHVNLAIYTATPYTSLPPRVDNRQRFQIMGCSLFPVFCKLMSSTIYTFVSM